MWLSYIKDTCAFEITGINLLTLFLTGRTWPPKTNLSVHTNLCSVYDIVYLHVLHLRLLLWEQSREGRHCKSLQSWEEQVTGLIPYLPSLKLLWDDFWVWESEENLQVTILIVSQSLLTQRGQAPSTRSSLVVQYHSISAVQWVRRSVIINGAIVAARSKKRGRSGSGRAMNIFYTTRPQTSLLFHLTASIAPLIISHGFRTVSPAERLQQTT